MNEKAIYDVLTKVIVYTFENNIAEYDKSGKQTSLVSLKNLESHLNQVLPTEYDVMKSYHNTLMDFLMSKEALECNTKWLYEIMTTTKYSQDTRRLDNTFLALKTYQMYSTKLFVIYLKKPISIEETLTDEMIECYKVKQMI